jgi:hypothetical protein
MMPRLAPAWLLLLAGASAAAEPPPAVIDGEHLFGKEAIDRVAQIAADLRQVNKIDLCIETMKEAPGLAYDAHKRMWTRRFEQARKAAAQDRADELGVDGLYVMITTNPKHVTVVGWPAYRDREEDTSDHKRKELQKALARLGRSNNADETLIQAIEKYKAMVREPARPSPLQTLPAIAVSGGLLGGWLLLRLLRVRTPERRPIYQPAMLGSIFGVAAGFWINDLLFQAERPAAPEADPQPLTEATVEAPANPEGIVAAPGGDQP